ncbi:MAG TPA: ribonucleotide-diphosphate reductase subunit beta [Patescibacteria group bacterium]
MIIGSSVDRSLQLRPLKYQWAYDLYNQAVANTWFPHEIQLGEDLADWKKMTEEERHAVSFFISFFNPSELLVNRCLALGVYPYVTAPECHLYLAKQMWEEANHSVAFEYVVETFPIERENAFTAHITTPSMAAKKDFNLKFLQRMTEDSLDIETIEGKKDFVRNLVATNIIMEGIWFYSGFMVGLSFRQRNLMRNFGSLLDWVVRDESLHLQFGINLILTILDESPELLEGDFGQEIHQMIVDSVELESVYNKDLLPNGILGLNADYVNKYVQYIADRRLEELGFQPHYNASNPAKWMSTANDVFELVNFFESTNTSYEVDVRADSNKKKDESAVSSQQPTE